MQTKNATSATSSPASPTSPSSRDALSALDLKVTSGAAPGYIDDRACAICHKEQAQSYQSVGMSRALYRPRPDKMDEDFANSHFFHAPSQRHYEVKQRGDEYIFRRYQLDEDKQPINVFERKIDWVMGSGSTSRVYLYQTELGEIYQLPISWYTQTRHWGMAPGFDNDNHPGLLRLVRHECMFCHNAYPEVPSGHDAFGGQDVFPHDLPEGIGCQRCHGPGAEHSRLAFAGNMSIDQLNQTIINPGRLKPQLLNDVCFECHLQSSVTLNGVRRFGRPAYSFRPGESLQDYMVMLDVDEAGKSKEERFDINHHPYRLLQSRCYQESQAALTCLTCHDPHRKVPKAERAAHYRNACLGCHTLDRCDVLNGSHTLTEVSTDSQSEATLPEETQAAIQAADCVSCHMPRRRTHDVVHVVMTDHRIQRRAAPQEERLAPLKETPPLVTNVTNLEITPDYRPPKGTGKLYRAFAKVHIGGKAKSVDRLKRYLKMYPQQEIDPYLSLAMGQLRQQQYAGAEKTLRTVLDKQPKHGLALELLGTALHGQHLFQAAIEVLHQSILSRPDDPDAHAQLGISLAASGQLTEAIRSLEHAIALRPNFPKAWFQLGQALGKQGQLDKAAESYRQTLTLQPNHSQAYEALGWTLMQQGQSAQALRYWRHGARVARQTQALTALVTNFASASSETDPP